MTKKIKVGVLMGGQSAEREISLISGRAAVKALDKRKYDVLPIQISTQGKFLFDKKLYLELNNKKKKDYNAKQALMLGAGAQLSARTLDVMFIALHGTYGEDGAIQGLLETMGIPYTGSGILASALAMDKEKSADIYNSRHILTPDYVAFGKKTWPKSKKEVLEDIKKLGTPLVVKPVSEGSAVGVSIVKDKKKLVSVIDKTLKKFLRIMVQEFIEGEEATCGVLEENGRAFAVPPTRIIANHGEFYDYSSKYDKGGSTHICPADFPEKVNRALQDLAIRAHLALGCRGMSRTDFIVTPKRKIYTLETNTIPGMTAVSLLPEAAAKIGINFSQMLDLVIKASLKK